MEIVEAKQNQEKTFTESQVTLSNRTILTITGVEKVFETNQTKIQLKVAGSNVVISGEGLNIAKLEIETGIVQIDGRIDEIKYYTGSNKDNLFKKLFR